MYLISVIYLTYKLYFLYVITWFILLYLFLDEIPKLQHFSAVVLQKEYCQAVKVIYFKVIVGTQVPKYSSIVLFISLYVNCHRKIIGIKLKKEWNSTELK